MKFKLCSKYSIIKYSIDLEQLLSSCIDLLLDIVSLLGYTNEDRFGAVFSYEEQNSDITNQSDSLIARVISDVEERMLTMCQSQVNQICLLDIKNKTILVSSDISIKDLKGILNKVITDIGPIKMLFNYVVDPHKDLLNRLLQLNPYKYGGTCVNIPYDMRMDSPILPVDWFEKIGDLYPTERDSIYLSDDFLCSLNTSIHEVEISECYLDCNDSMIGYVINRMFIPLCDITSHVNRNYMAAFYFKMIENIYSKENVKYSCKKPDDFIKEAKKNSFVKLLGNLECNFYLKDDNLICNKYSHYFERVISHDSLKHVQNTHIYTNSHVADTNTVLGIYTPEKIGDNFHLLHWISNKENDNKCEHYHGDNPKSYDIKSVYALKPEYSFYFVRKYYEDILDTILSELNCSYILNRSFESAVNHEVDAIILCDNKIVIIEAKTRLSAKTIEDAIKKTRHLHPVWKETFPDVKVEYITIAQFSDNLDKTIDYFLPDKTRKTDFYTGLFRYRFNIKMQQFDGVEIKFISEPSYNKMRNALAKIIQSK